MVNRLTQGKAVVGGLVAEESVEAADLTASDDLTVADDANVGGDLTVQGSLIVDGSIVFGDQQASIADPAGGATTDTEARTAIAAIIDALEAVGILEEPA